MVSGGWRRARECIPPLRLGDSVNNVAGLLISLTVTLITVSVLMSDVVDSAIDEHHACQSRSHIAGSINIHISTRHSEHVVVIQVRRSGAVAGRTTVASSH